MPIHRAFEQFKRHTQKSEMSLLGVRSKTRDLTTRKSRPDTLEMDIVIANKKQKQHADRYCDDCKKVTKHTIVLDHVCANAFHTTEVCHDCGKSGQFESLFIPVKEPS